MQLSATQSQETRNKRTEKHGRHPDN